MPAAQSWLHLWTNHGLLKQEQEGWEGTGEGRHSPASGARQGPASRCWSWPPAPFVACSLPSNTTGRSAALGEDAGTNYGQGPSTYGSLHPHSMKPCKHPNKSSSLLPCKLGPGSSLAWFFHCSC